MLNRFRTRREPAGFSLALPPVAAAASAAATGSARSPSFDVGADGAPPAQQPVVDAPAKGVTDSMTVGSLAEVGTFRSLLDVIPPQLQTKCLALDIQFNEVRLVCSPDFFGTGQHHQISQSLKARRYSVKEEVRATESVIADIRREAVKSHNTLVSITEESRNLQFYDDLIRGGKGLSASDIHMNIFQSGPSYVSVRRFGRIYQWKTFEGQALLDAVSAGFQSRTRAGSNSSGSFNPEIAGNTMTEHTIDELNVSARLSSQPQHNKGVGIVIRLLPDGVKGAKAPSLLQLGYTPSQTALVRERLGRKGLALVSGGTGSGKSTSLRSWIYDIPGFAHKAIRSVEEPVEYVMPEPNIYQVSIQTNPDDPPEAVRRKYNAALKNALRQDPDVLYASEVRDAEAASMLLESALTGHLSLGTMHGNGCIDQLLRASLPRIGMDAAILGALDTLSLSSYQAILPVLCKACCIDATHVLTREQQQVLTLKFGLEIATVKCANPAGCPHCWNAELDVGGYSGQTIAVELYAPLREHGPIIRAGQWDELEVAWRKTRRTAFTDEDMTGKTALEHAIWKVSRGEIDPRDVEAEFEPLEGYRLMELNHA
ncbi:ATPase, T2SS/T4P/T4SS family [Cupriavidus pauculus]|uniref:ATPase, T2SS/T4P/T4SS family n=1 Tax=Cupriavidus pauculus TaxID=82633 RepID=UPI003857526A